MDFKLDWNDLADQPHNVAPRSVRTRHHLKRWRTYFSLAWADLRFGIPGLELYRDYRRRMFRQPAKIGASAFAVAVSPRSGRDEGIVSLFKETGVREALVRIPSWERQRLPDFAEFVRRLRAEDIGVTIALLQSRDDVLAADGWRGFVEDVFARFHSDCRFFEIGHAWNRTKWGVWDFSEYLELARPAFELRDRYGVKLVGPAVIDFEFHLYPPTLSVLPFDVSSSLLYVDRVGAPENGQFGWTTAKKVALFKALSDSSAGRRCDCWITEVNWPLRGTGAFSPASGKPNVTEEEQADYLARYFIICLSSGLIERIYWWQLVAPGYGLVDNREEPWRRRPAFRALTTLRGCLAEATFTGKREAPGSEVFCFEKDGREFAAAWTARGAAEFDFGRPIGPVLGRDGDELPFPRGGGALRLDGSPKYVFFQS